MLACPINYYKDNLIFNADGSCWASYRLHGFNYDYLSTSGKIAKLVQLVRLFSGILSDAQILVIPVEQNLKEHFDGLRKRVNKNDVLYTTAVHQIGLTEEFLEEKTKRAGRINDYSTYIIVRLNQAAEYENVSRVWDIAQYFFRDPINAINVHMNLDTKDVLASRIKACAKMAQRWFQDSQLKIEMDPTTTEETQWLFRRLPYRGTGGSTKLFYKNTNMEVWEPEKKERVIEKEKIIKPYHRDIVNLFSGAITAENRCLKVTTGFTTSYQTFLTLASIPDTMEYPGTEWLYMLQKQNLQAEICIQIKLIPHKTALHKLDLKKREVDSQIEHVMSANADVPEDLDVSKDFANIMEQELKESRAPILDTTVTICLADSDYEMLEKKCSQVKELYDDINFVVERPLSDQIKLYMSFIPSVKNLMKDFVLPLTPITVASGIIGVTRELGDRRGGFIGTIGEEEKPVFFAAELACLMNMSPAITFFGDLGVGKSFNANLLIYLLVLYGGYGLIIDPKGERSHWIKELTALQGLISIVTLGAGEADRGKLDPYNIFPDDIAEAHELAMNVLAELFRLDPKGDENTIIIECQQRMSKTPGKNSMMKLAGMLDSIPETDELSKIGSGLARKIRTQRGNGMAGLLVGNGDEEAITLENRLNIIQLQNLKMPDPAAGKEDYTRDEILSSIIFGQISAFVKKFAMVKRPVPKGVLIDESWFVSASTQGRNMEDFISRMGRSLFTVIMYNGHSVTDLPTEGIRNSITYKFVFRSRNNEKEAARLLEYIGLEVTPENMAIIKNLPAGHCFFKDLYNRVGVLKFDVVFQDIYDVFSTTPTEDASKLRKDKPEQPEGVEAGNQETEPLEAVEKEPEMQEEPDNKIFDDAYREEIEEVAKFNFSYAETDLFEKEEL